MHDMVKPLPRIVVASFLKDLGLDYGQEDGQRAEQKEGNWCYGLQGHREEDSPKQRNDLVVNMALLVDSWCYRVPDVAGAQSSLGFHKVHERFRRALRPQSNENNEIDYGTR